MSNRIKDLREDKDLKQSELAEKVGIDQRTISNYETGKTSPDADALIRLANFFDVTIDYLVCRTNFNYSSKSKIDDEIDEIIQKLTELKKYI